MLIELKIASVQIFKMMTNNRLLGTLFPNRIEIHLNLIKSCKTIKNLLNLSEFEEIQLSDRRNKSNNHDKKSQFAASSFEIMGAISNCLITREMR